MTTGDRLANDSETLIGLPGLRAARADKLLTQHELAAQSGVNATTISDLEGGRRTARYRTIRQLAAALGVKPLELLTAPVRRTTRTGPAQPGTRGNTK